jgi:hypothetical protein
MEILTFVIEGRAESAPPSKFETVTRRVVPNRVTTISNFALAAPTIEVASLPPTRSETAPAPTSAPPLTPQQVAPIGMIVQDQAVVEVLRLRPDARNLYD